jgi:predicted RNA-binding protein YlxR (DUF448 family)
LIRVVTDSVNEFSFDPALCRGGRGAYVCRDPECLKRAVLRGHLARALKAQSSNDREAVFQRLLQALK